MTSSAREPNWEKIHVAIMAGGGGTRFWPLSRENLPKQFLRFVDNKSMLRLSTERLLGKISPERIWILTNHVYRDLIEEELPEIPAENILVEPSRRDTSAAIMLGTAIIEKSDPDSKMLVLTSDHLIFPQEEFFRTLSAACLALEDRPETLFVFGISPSEPAIHFGYLNRGTHWQDINGLPIYEVSRFVEKPNLAVAKEYFHSGNYYWNSGMFAWKVSTIMDQLRVLLPLHYKGARELQKAWQTPGWPDQLTHVFQNLPKISIDYGVMEKAASVALVEASFEWNDVGTWDALEEIYPQENNNVVLGKHLGIKTKGCIIHSEKQLITTIGLEDLVIVSTDDALLIVPKKEVNQVKGLVNQLKEKGFEKYC